MSRRLTVSRHVRRALAERGKPIGPQTDVETVTRLAFTALAAGAQQTGMRSFEWDVSGKCRSPKQVERWSAVSGKARYIGKDGRKAPVYVLLHVPCRKCEACMRKRSNLWRFRAIHECQQSERTWFGTLTASPEHHHMMELRARAATPNWDDLSPSAQFSLRAQEMGREATLWLKRVRERASAQFRYLLVTEIHDSKETSPEMRFMPHLHCLIHEFPGAPIRKRKLSEPWHLGHTRFVLVDDPVKGAMYLCKYISKASEARIRASFGYGETVGFQDALGHREFPSHKTNSRGVTDPSPSLPKPKTKDGKPALKGVNRHGSTCMDVPEAGAVEGSAAEAVALPLSTEGTE